VERSVTPRRSPRPRLLVVTAVEAERAAVRRGLGIPVDREDSLGHGDRIVVETGGVGPANAAASAAWLLGIPFGAYPFHLVVSAGVAGGFDGRADLGAAVLASRSVAADLGADSPEGFLPLDELGLGSSTAEADPDVLASLREALPKAVVGEVLTVSTVTGSADRAAALLARHPEAVAEAMEGFGVATAASRAGTAFAELRTISNPVGPRDRDLWRLTEALAALEAAAGALANLVP